MVRLSVIVPVYNVELYLRRCVDSILDQTYTDFEVLLIDDGSQDKSGAICDEYAAKDFRVSVFHKKNGGVSSARNIGIDKAMGEWIYFVDADDELFPYAFETLIMGISDDVDIIMGGHIRIDECGEIMDAPPVEYSEIIRPTDALRLMYHPKNFNAESYLWDKLFRRDAIARCQLRFNEDLSLKEDCLFIVQLLCKISAFVYYTTKIVYKYYRNKGSAMSVVRASYTPKMISIFRAHQQQILSIALSHQSISLRVLSIWYAYRSIRNIKSTMCKYGCYDKHIIGTLRYDLRKQIGLVQFECVVAYEFYFKVKKHLLRLF